MEAMLRVLDVEAKRSNPVTSQRYEHRYGRCIPNRTRTESEKREQTNVQDCEVTALCTSCINGGDHFSLCSELSKFGAEADCPERQVSTRLLRLFSKQLLKKTLQTICVDGVMSKV